MVISGLARIKCFALIEGFESSVAENLVNNFQITGPEFFSKDEQERALKRMTEDLGDPTLKIDETYAEELLRYLDLGDLVNIMNRHASSAKNIVLDDVKSATKLINQSEVLSIRKRVMHPVRPLELDDLPKLLKLSESIISIAKSMKWDVLEIALKRVNREDLILDKAIPSYWAEDQLIIHNLPAAEFDETGFIGRRKERKDLRKWIESEHRVITVVGEGGIGKTALSLRVCNDIIEENLTIFDRIVWVSLKTKYLTTEGIREINNAIDSVGHLIESLSEVLGEGNGGNNNTDWDRVIEQMRLTRTLLVVDNLETISEGIRGLALYIPSGSKLLLTSRVGLGELEVRYELAEFLPKDAMALFRSLVNIYNFNSLLGIKDDVVHFYVQSLKFNPLLIKWFVLAVGKGMDPNMLLKGGGIEEPLKFCYENIYETLGDLEKNILAIVMAARRDLTIGQLMELTGGDPISLRKASQELIRTSMVSSLNKDDGSIALHLGGLVYEYLRTRYPPENKLVIEVRKKIKEWQITQDKSAVQHAIYRYGIKAIHVSTEDERISAQHVMRALNAIRVVDFGVAESAIAQAEQITPTWWEVYRVKARLFEAENKPIYEIEDMYEQSIRCNDNDVNRYHYAAYLIRIDEYERAIEQLEEAKKFPGAYIEVLNSLHGQALMRMGLTNEAIELLQYVWEKRPKDLPARVGRIQGTLLVDAYRRDMEQIKIKRLSVDCDVIVKALEVIDACHKDFGCDPKLAEMAVNFIATAEGVIEDDKKERIKKFTRNWDENEEFRSCADAYRELWRHFDRAYGLAEYFPKTYKMVLGEHPDLGKAAEKINYCGTVQSIIDRKSKPYGFISCKELGVVYFNQNSLSIKEDWNLVKEGVDVEFIGVQTSEGYSPLAKELRLASKE